LVLIYLGLQHPATVGLAEANPNPDRLVRALAELAIVPILRHRRLLAAYAAPMPRPHRSGAGYRARKAGPAGV
jgi:hypothetical protein